MSQLKLTLTSFSVRLISDFPPLVVQLVVIIQRIMRQNKFIDILD